MQPINAFKKYLLFNTFSSETFIFVVVPYFLCAVESLYSQLRYNKNTVLLKKKKIVCLIEKCIAKNLAVMRENSW